MALLVCKGCTTRYAPGLSRCPHCGSPEWEEDGMQTQPLPAFVQTSCDTRGCPAAGTVRQVRLRVISPGLVEMPPLLCAACGCTVRVPWPTSEKEDEAVPKITRHGGPSNAAADAATPTPASAADQPTSPVAGEVGPELVDLTEPEHADAEAGTEQAAEHPDADPASLDAVQTEADPGEADTSPEPDTADGDRYEGMTLAELRDAAEKRGLARSGSKAVLQDRLREDDAQEQQGGEA